MQLRLLNLLFGLATVSTAPVRSADAVQALVDEITSQERSSLSYSVQPPTSAWASYRVVSAMCTGHWKPAIEPGWFNELDMMDIATDAELATGRLGFGLGRIASQTCHLDTGPPDGREWLIHRESHPHASVRALAQPAHYGTLLTPLATARLLCRPGAFHNVCERELLKRI